MNDSSRFACVLPCLAIAALFAVLVICTSGCESAPDRVEGRGDHAADRVEDQTDRKIDEGIDRIFQ